MSAAIIYPQADGSVAVIHLPPDIHLRADQIAAQDLPHETPYGVFDASTLPQDSIFRDSLEAEIQDGRVVNVRHNLEKAKEIQRHRWRTARKPLLEKLDEQYLKADETGNNTTKTEIAAKKKALRDVTLTDLSGVSTVEELKNVWPSILNS